MNSLEPVVIELDGNNKNEISLISDSGLNTKSSINFGGGIELLMNDKKRGGSNKTLGDLSELENELNELSSTINEKNIDNTRDNIFNKAININFKDNKTIEKEELQLSDENNLGKQTVGNMNNTKTWDGYGKVHPIPNDADEPQLTKEELVREKFKFLIRL